MVPECFFDDTEDNKEFINRGCAAGKKHILLNVNGDSHACVHESKSYGNIHKIGLRKIWDNMAEWRGDKYIPNACKECPRLSSCMGGCRMVALAHTGSLRGMDNLCKGHAKPDASKQINVRYEEGFLIFRERGAKVHYIDV